MKNKILKLVLFLGIFFILNFCAGWLMKGNMYNSFGRATLHDLHTKEKIDVLYLGDSHLYAGLDVNKLEELTGLSSIIAATASQEPDGHYVLLRETYKYHPELKQVYIDLDYLNNFQGDFKDRNHLRNIYTISDNLKDKKLKADYLLHATSPKYYLNHSLIFGKNRISGNPKDAITMVKMLISGEYWKYTAPVSGTQQYIKNGYIPDSGINNNYFFKSSEEIVFNQNEISKDWYKYVDKIVEFCKENNIELNFFAVCETDFKIFDTINYDEYYTFIKNLSDKYNTNYYDFNLSKKLDLTYLDFYDDEHLNLDGSQKFTQVFYDSIFNQTESENSYFYNSLKEKQLEQSEKISGFTFTTSDNGKNITIHPVGNILTSNITYIIYLNDFNNQISDNGSNNVIVLPEKTNGTLLIKCLLNNVEYCNLEYIFNTEWIN